MAVYTTKAVAATVAQLITRVRRLLGDGSTTAGNQRWSDTDIRQAIDDMIAQMYVESADGDPGSFLLSGTMTYTAESESVAIPTSVDPASVGIYANQIYKVEEIDSTGHPIFLPYINPHEITKFSDQSGWTILGDNIALRPQPTKAKTLRLWWLANFTPTSSTTSDQHKMSVNHEQLISLGAAIMLQEIDDEVPASRLLRYNQLWDAYSRSCQRLKGRIYVSPTRSFY